MALAFFLLGLLIFLFIIIPLAKMIFSSVSEAEILWQTILDPEVTGAIGLTLYAALIVVPHTAAGIALLFVFGRRFFLGSAFEAIGIEFVDSIAGIIIAMLFVSIPFLIDSAKEGFKKVDVRLEKVARTLGASPWQAFFRVSFPLAWRSILAGNIMMWARGISEFGAVIILAYHPMIAPVLVYERFETYGLDYARPIAVLLILVSVLVFIVLRAIAYRGDKS
jgi:molybdate/tungstate transport system permease protein